MKAPGYGFGESELYHAKTERKHAQLRANGLRALTNVEGHKKLAPLVYLFVCDRRSQSFLEGFRMRLIISVLVIAVVAVGALTACNSADWKNTRTSQGAPAGAPPPPQSSDGARRVTVAELKDLLAKNEAVVLDVRNQTSYDAGHIRGARLIPEAEVVNHADELPRDKLIVTYCS
jgi:hypothetical protein